MGLKREQKMLRYFALSASLLCAIYFGSTWWIWLQGICLLVLCLSDGISWAVQRRMEVDIVRQEVQRQRVHDLNPHKWG
jgi:hypothetical protein